MQGKKSHRVRETTERLYEQLTEAGLEVTVFEEFSVGHHIRAIVATKP